MLLALQLHRILEDAEDMLHLCSRKLPGEKFNQKIVPSVLGLENLLCDFWCTVQEKEIHIDLEKSDKISQEKVWNVPYL